MSIKTSYSNCKPSSAFKNIMCKRTKLLIVDSQARSGDGRVHGEDIITTLATQHRGVAPASPDEQQHHQQNHGERRDGAYICRRLHCTKHITMNFCLTTQKAITRICLPLVGLMTPRFATILLHFIAESRSR